MMNAATVHAPLPYLLQLADSALVLGQRNAEWCGHGPVLEEDIAMANISLDLVGQARLLYQHAAAVAGEGATEDSLAYFRDAGEFRNYVLLELPHHRALAPTAAARRDYAVTIVRNFLFGEFMVRVWQALQSSSDPQLAGIAAKSLKETRYHLRHAADWLVKFGDGTDESHERAQAALDHLLPYTQEFWTLAPHEEEALSEEAAPDPRALRADWDAAVDELLAEAGLRRSPATGFLPQGKLGLHSEHMGFLLAEMQSLARQHPGASW